MVQHPTGCFKARCVGARRAADIQRMHHCRKFDQCRVVFKPEARHEHFEGHLVADMGQSRFVEVKPQRALRTLRRTVEPRESCVPVDKATNEPGARNTVDPKMPARGLGATLVIAGEQARNGACFGIRLVGRQDGIGRSLKIGPGSLRAYEGISGKEINALEILQFLAIFTAA
jgi:hypothetical protein